MNVSRLLFFGIVLGPLALFGQRKEDLQSIQRDVAQLQEQVSNLQKSEDAKMAALQGLLQQAADGTNRVNSALAALQREINAKLTDQQTSLVSPVATLGTKVDQMSEDFRSVAANVAELVRRMDSLDSKLADISSAVRTLSTPPSAPPGSPSGTAPSAGGTMGPPPGMSAQESFQNAYRDYNGANYTLAMQEFSDFLKYFGQTASAPAAQYYIGQMYYSAGQYDDAAKAFDAVLERYPENDKTADALYYKAVSLMKGNHRTEAGAEFKAYLKRYPGGDHVTQAHSNLKLLGLEPARSASKKRG